MLSQILLVFLNFCILASRCQQYTGLDGAAKYLSKYGYIDAETPSSHMSLSDIRESLMAFQEMTGLEPTGRLNEETLQVMNTPRCGNKDNQPENIEHHNRTQQGRYSLVGSKWENRQIKYKITQYSRQRISQQFTDSIIHQAFRLWAQHTNLEFIRTNGPEVDIEIRFTEGHHGDRYPFPYGDRGQLAHAFYPGSGLGGDVHFNDEIDWSSKNMLLYAATHEIGHSLGLGHSSNQDSIMFSHLLRVKDEIELHYDDVSGIQQVYGGREFPNRTPAPAPPPTEPTTQRPTTTSRRTTSRPTTTSSTTERRVDVYGDRDICADSQIDAITALDNGDILVFKGEYVHTLRTVNARLERQPPRLIKEVFSNRLPSGIDAAFSRDSNKLYFMKGNLYWRAAGLTIDENYPKEISRHLPGVPDNLDAAMMGADKQLYFFKGNKFWKLNPRGRSRQAAVHTIQAHWQGVPNGNIDAAFRSPEGKTYLFKGQNYWRLNETSNKVVVAYPPYPRETKKWWFSC